MGLPSSGDNLSGYTTAQLITHSTGLRDKEYFLIHGSLDDNVHYQQSMLWAKQLEHDDVLFRQQVCARFKTIAVLAIEIGLQITCSIVNKLQYF